jgi:hypothetical protein
MNVSNTRRGRAATILGFTALVGLPGAFSVALATGAQAATTEQMQADWREAIRRTPTPAAGCFHAAFPETKWTRVECSTRPAVPAIHKTGHGSSFTTGNGNDYGIVTNSLISEAVGSFPSVTGVKTEKGADGANSYTLQLNSTPVHTSACNATAHPTTCEAWQQAVYSTGEGIVFFQYWLIGSGKPCPAGGGWSYYSGTGSCYKNSAETRVPTQVITQLGNLKLTATASSGGNDTTVLTTASDAYSASGPDTVTDLASVWKYVEFNIVGDGGGSEAKFNSGSHLTVNVALTDGSTAAPTCNAHDGETGETNNLTLGACTVAGGSTPSATFTESN